MSVASKLASGIRNLWVFEKRRRITSLIVDRFVSNSSDPTESSGNSEPPQAGFRARTAKARFARSWRRTTRPAPPPPPPKAREAYVSKSRVLDPQYPAPPPPPKHLSPEILEPGHR